MYCVGVILSSFSFFGFFLAFQFFLEESGLFFSDFIFNYCKSTPKPQLLMHDILFEL